MIVEREAEIEKFEPQEYWTLEADTEKDSKAISAKLRLYKNEKVAQFTINNTDSADAAHHTLPKAAAGTLKVVKVE